MAEGEYAIPWASAGGMKLIALTARSLSEVEQADERLRRTKRPAKRFKLVIGGESSVV
jgi:hypothetical protein